MSKVIDLATFRRITSSVMAVHELIRTGSAFVDDATEIQAVADRVLREAGMTYMLQGGLPPGPTLPLEMAATAADVVVSRPSRLPSSNCTLP